MSAIIHSNLHDTCTEQNFNTHNHYDIKTKGAILSACGLCN